MSLELLANVCSHVSNASKARLGLTSIPNTKLHLRLALQLQNSGFISTVVRGGPSPPPPHQLLSHPSHELEPITQENIASRRLWLGLKYWNSEPVLEKMELVSKPTRRIWMDVEGLATLHLLQQVVHLPLLARILQVLEMTQENDGFAERRAVRCRVCHGSPPSCESRVDMDSALSPFVTYSFTRSPWRQASFLLTAG